MPRYRRPPLTVHDILTPGAPIRLRDLVAMSGLSSCTLRTDIALGHLSAVQRLPRPNSPYFIVRSEALRYLSTLGVQARQAS